MVCVDTSSVMNMTDLFETQTLCLGVEGRGGEILNHDLPIMTQ